ALRAELLSAAPPLLSQLEPRRLLGQRAQSRSGLAHGNEGRLSQLILACSRLLRAREAILASGESPGHQRAGVREQRIGLLVQRSRRESEPRELLTYPGSFLRHARPP